MFVEGRQKQARVEVKKSCPACTRHANTPPWHEQPNGACATKRTATKYEANQNGSALVNHTLDYHLVGPRGSGWLNQPDKHRVCNHDVDKHFCSHTCRHSGSSIYSCRGVVCGASLHQTMWLTSPKNHSHPRATKTLQLLSRDSAHSRGKRGMWSGQPRDFDGAGNGRTTHRGNRCTARALCAHCALLLDYVPPEEPPSTPLGNTLRLSVCTMWALRVHCVRTACALRAHCSHRG